MSTRRLGSYTSRARITRVARFQFEISPHVKFEISPRLKFGLLTEPMLKVVVYILFAVAVGNSTPAHYMRAQVIQSISRT